MSIPRSSVAGKFIIGVVVMMIISAFLSGCSAGAFKKLKIQVTASQVRVGGRNFAVFTLAALNAGEDPVKLQFSSGMQFDFVVTKGGEEVWRWSHDKAFIMMLTEREVSPGELVAHSVVWEGTDLAGEQVPSGEYQIAAEVATKPRLVTGRVKFNWSGR